MDTPEGEPPRVVSSEEIFRGRIFGVAVDTVREGRTTYKREVVRHPGGAAVVAVFDDLTVALVRQYRHPTGRYLLELPAGKLEAGEPPADCAARELAEEVGVTAARVEPLSEFYTTPGFCGEKLWVFLATGLTEGRRALEEDEIVEAFRLPLSRALGMVASGEVEDAKTVIGLLLAAQRLGVARDDA